MGLIKDLKAKMTLKQERKRDAFEKYTTRIIQTNRLHKEAEKAFKGCGVHWGNYMDTHTISVFLNKDYNLTKHVNVFVDEHLSVLNDFLDGRKEYLVEDCKDSLSMDYKWGHITLCFYYGDARCTRKKVGTEIVEKDIYEVECY